MSSGKRQRSSHQQIDDVGAGGDNVYLGKGDDIIFLGDSHALLDNNANSQTNIQKAQDKLE
ncbi:hypothetical protein, partial [Vibrio cholerae]|uniref:hypothetical protein n=1 Tax=Vibrio cholerae TaxID=666 RepID=UPI003F649CC4